MPMHLFRHLALILLLLVVGITTAWAQDAEATSTTEPAGASEPWVGAFANGDPLTREELEKRLAAHAKWLKTAEERLDEKWAQADRKEAEKWNWRRELLASDWGADEGRLMLQGAILPSADLQGTNLSDANLQEAFLWFANLQEAELMRADLQGAFLINIDLQGAILWGANLQGANLSGVDLQEAGLMIADLQGADLRGANLQEANLHGANLQEANLHGADLQEANLHGADLQEANLEGANLQGVIYETKLGSGLPDVVSLRSASDLENMRFERSPHALNDLLKAFKDAGYHQQEREITYALKRSEWENTWQRSKAAWEDSRWFELGEWFWLGAWIEATFNYVFFDLTVRYGLAPGRALWLLLGTIVLFSFAYMASVCNRRPVQAGIWKTWPEHGIHVISGYHPRNIQGYRDPERVTASGLRIPLWGIWFSVLSAFHIGWRDLSIGNWLVRINPDEYTLQATGWVKVVSGIQSLISIYLLAMWVLTYFGRPFSY